MRVPMCRVHCVGELSEWGRAFVSDLERDQLIDAVFFDSASSFISQPLSHTIVPIIFLENLEATDGVIEMLRQSGRSMYLVWFGQSFSKEQLAYALEKRVYGVFEGTISSDPIVIESLRKLSYAVELNQQFDQVLHSLKTLILQVEGESGLKPIIQELKAACKKLQATTGQNELLGVPDPHTVEREAKSPFYQAFDLTEALLTVGNLERTGTLWIKDALGEREGRIEFLQGRVIAASASEVRGVKAIYRMYLWEDPTFQFTRREPKDSIVEEQLNVSMNALCNEGEAHRERFRGIKRSVPPADLLVELAPEALHPNLELSESEFSTLASVVEFGRVQLIVDQNPRADISLYESLIELRRNQMIRVVGT